MLTDILIFIGYACILSGLIVYNGFFKLFDDTVISRKRTALLFMGKLIAVPAFLLVYIKIYGGIDNFDTGKFFHDSLAIYEFGKKDPAFLFRILFGLQDDSPGSYDYANALVNTSNWDNGTVKDYLYNDNRVLIRIHVLINFIAFNSYILHALFNCFLSFIGIFFCYKTFKEWFSGKELWVLLILCFFPSLWFYTGAILKEGITFFVLGCTLYQLKRVIQAKPGLLAVVWLMFLLFLSFLLKPYLLSFAVICFSLFFAIRYSERIRRKTLFFFSCIALTVLGINAMSLAIKHRSLLSAALEHQHRFIGVSKGGLFLADSVDFIRLTNDTTQIQRVSGKRDVFTIKKNVSYMYWKTAEQTDTLYCSANQDTSRTYQWMYNITPGNSNIQLPRGNPVFILGGCLYYTLFYPTLISAKNALQLLAALENLVIILALLVLFLGLVLVKKDRFLPLTFIFFSLSLCILIGLTAPNSGAIFRYRSPAMVFLLLTALYYSTEIRILFGKKNTGRTD